MITNTQSANAAKDTRAATNVSVGISLRMTALKKKDPPQMNDRVISISQSMGDMRMGVSKQKKGPRTIARPSGV
jgi:hypothetical protein